MKESTSVSLELVASPGTDAAAITALVGVEPTMVRHQPQQPHVWELTLKGPSPVNAGRVANDLARDLLARVGAAEHQRRETWARMRDAHDTEVRFLFKFRSLQNFSYGFDADVIRGLAELEAMIGLYHYEERHDRTPLERFGSGASPDEGCEVSLRLAGEHLDTDAATRLLGVQPSASGRRRDGASYWLLDGTSPKSRDADEPILELLARVTKSEAWAALSHENKVHLLVAFRVRQMTGYFDLDVATMRALADCGCGLDASFYDWGPEGADLLS